MKQVLVVQAIVGNSPLETSKLASYVYVYLCDFLACKHDISKWLI